MINRQVWSQSMGQCLDQQGPQASTGWECRWVRKQHLYFTFAAETGSPGLSCGSLSRSCGWGSQVKPGRTMMAYDSSSGPDRWNSYKLLCNCSNQYRALLALSGNPSRCGDNLRQRPSPQGRWSFSLTGLGRWVTARSSLLKESWTHHLLGCAGGSHFSSSVSSSHYRSLYC